MSDDMALDLTTSSNPITEREPPRSQPIRVLKWRLTSEPHAPSPTDLIVSILSMPDLQVESVEELLRSRQAAIKLEEGVKQEVTEIAAEFPPDIVVVDDSSDDEAAVARRAKRARIGDSSSPSMQSQDTSSNTASAEDERILIDFDNECEVGFWEPPEFQVGQIYLVPSFSGGKENWIQAKLLEKTSSQTFKVLLLKKGETTLTNVKYFAQLQQPTLYLKIGSRAIATFNKFAPTGEIDKGRKTYKLGMVAEYPSKTNHSRYLIIFDNGYWLYVFPIGVRPLLHVCKHVWKDVPFSHQKTLKDYLGGRFSQMQHFEYNDIVRLEGPYEESNNYYHVISTDASLVLLWDRHTNQLLWVHRGSPSLRSATK